MQVIIWMFINCNFLKVIDCVASRIEVDLLTDTEIN